MCKLGPRQSLSAPCLCFFESPHNTPRSPPCTLWLHSGFSSCSRPHPTPEDPQPLPPLSPSRFSHRWGPAHPGTKDSPALVQQVTRRPAVGWCELFCVYGHQRTRAHCWATDKCSGRCSPGCRLAGCADCATVCSMGRSWCALDGKLFDMRLWHLSTNLVWRPDVSHQMPSSFRHSFLPCLQEPWLQLWCPGLSKSDVCTWCPTFTPSCPASPPLAPCSSPQSPCTAGSAARPGWLTY